jgi:hypothetical protein
MVDQLIAWLAGWELTIIADLFLAVIASLFLIGSGDGAVILIT